jgi:hypothetical protein
VFAQEPQLLNVQKIWDKGTHNAFTDLIRFEDQWYCAFREGQDHASDDGKIRVLRSAKGQRWESVAFISYPAPTSKTKVDVRDAKLSVTPDGKLMLNSVVHLTPPVDGLEYQSLAWFSLDGTTWTEAHPIAERNVWMWKVNWHNSTAYGIGRPEPDGHHSYGKTNIHLRTRLYRSTDGKDWHVHVEKLFTRGYSNESAMAFSDDGTCYCLLRRDGWDPTAQLGISHPPYKKWQWKDLGVRVGGPEMIQLADGRLLATVRLYDQGPYTALAWIDPKAGTFTKCLRLPSGGDTSYAGMVLHEGLLWISYYSSHEGKSSIYLAKLSVK